MSLLAARGLEVCSGQLPVIRNLDLDVAAGSVLGLVGESGAGKSMIGRTIAGMLPDRFSVTSGSLAFDGQDLLGMKSAKRRALFGREIAFIPQEPLTSLNPVLTIGAQLDEHLSRLGVANRRAASVAALEGVHLLDAEALLRRYPHQLSGGMCQRVLIAMAFAGSPKLVVADEPTTALDVTVQARVMALMRELQRAHGTAVLFITHDLRLAAGICDEVAVLYAGSVIERGPVRAVLRQPGHPYTRCLELANPPMRGPPRALYALPDQMPGPRAIAGLPGCHFEPRCPAAVAKCRLGMPALRLFEDSAREAACFRAGEPFAIIAPDWAARAVPKRAADPLLSVENLERRFSAGPLFRRTATMALRGVSLTVARGEFVAVVGESGSGKSTLGRLIAGLDFATGGKIVLSGRDITGGGKAARRHRIARVQMVFQDPQSALNPRRSVADIVTQSMAAAGRGLRAREARARDLIRDMGMPGEVMGRTPAQLSGGQRQRVNIARALCSLPRLLVADEIVSGLDVSIQAQLLMLLQKLRTEQDFALLFISHDLSVVRHLCDRVLVMRAGEIVEQGRVEDVFERPAHEYTKALLAAVPGEIGG